MTDWLDQYSAALDQRDAREQAHKSYIDAYTKLADRSAAVTVQKRAALPPEPPSPRPPSSTSKLPDRTSTPVKGKPASPAPSEQSPVDALTRLRIDLATTQKARSTLQAQLSALTAELKALESQHRASTNQIAQLTQQKTETERKLRDRDEELRGKTKLAEDAQDEMVALGLQLNISEAKSKKLESENKELVERWMKRMGEEAERVNRESRWD